MDINICYLEDQHRQGDKSFLRVLNDIRGNSVTKDTSTILRKRLNKEVATKIKPTKLHTHNRDVDSYNNSELDKIEEDEVVYEMKSNGDKHLIKGLKNGYCLAPEILKLKKGAVVMFVRNNFGKKYVNGTLGKVIGFDADDNYPIVETISGNTIVASPESWNIEDGSEVVASVSQVPLRLAWAITVHKSQGMSLDCAEIDLSKTFEYGMGYVALSRVRSLNGIKLVGINSMALKVNKEAIKLNKILFAKSKKDLKKSSGMDKKAMEKKQKDFLRKNKDDDNYNTIFEYHFK